MELAELKQEEENQYGFYVNLVLFLIRSSNLVIWTSSLLLHYLLF